MDLTSPKMIKELAQKFNFGFSKGLGQNFLLDRSVLEDISEAAGSNGGVLEIGPGFGVLTYELAKHHQKVVAIEIDNRLIPVLQDTLAEYENVKVVEGDILKIDLYRLIKEEFGNEKISVAANLPYYITTPILAKLLESRLPLHHIVVMVQKEVADRICARPGSKNYGAISILCQYYTKPEIITIVPAGSFMPPPKVDSAVLKLAVSPEPNVSVLDEKLFFRIVKASFAQRRKTLLNGLSNGLSLDKIKLSALLEEMGIRPDIRGEKLSIEEFANISNAVKMNIL